MKIKTAWRVLAFSAVFGLGLIGCGGDGNPSGGDNNTGGNNNGGGNNTGVGSVPIEKWMTTNLNVETADSWCYDDDPANCEMYGRLYTLEAAKVACLSVGKRLPTNQEWDALVTAAGGSSTAGKKLKSTSGWNNNGNGTNDFGFSALPGGNRSSDGTFNFADNIGEWWTATDGGGNDAYHRYIHGSSDNVYERNDRKRYGFSVRCVEG
ncbi:MAG: hypothetical protein LBC59_03200 [Chitinispirillales bacterium]|jgi:uncharacterized protein (TIGR02145 family)|nr:hypothetical protein [Chitinispirillales bacterium]